MGSSIWGQLLVQLILIALNAVFACAEIAILSVNDTRLSMLSQKGDKRAKTLQKLTEQPARFLATIQVAITLSGFLGSAFAAENFSDKLVDFLIKIGVGIPEKTLNTVCVILITLILSYFTLVLGELVPKRVAMKKAESLALIMASMISFISRLFAPVVWLLTASTNFMLRLFGIDPNEEEEAASEEDIIMMVDASAEKGEIDEEEQEMIQNVFEFDRLPVRDFATHRTDMAILWQDESMEEWEETIRSCRHTLLPLCGETTDEVLGVLNVKDYFRLEDKSRENVMENAVTPALFVSEGTYADVLFRQMKKARKHFAIVLDEYGGVSGIVTMTDILEQIVGDLEDDEDGESAEKEIRQLEDGSWQILGSAPLEEVSEALEIEISEGEFETFSGLVLGSYGAIPDDGTQFEIDVEGMHVCVQDIQDHCVDSAIVTLLPKEETEE